MLEILSVGGPTANRFDAPRAVAQLRRQIGNLSTELATDEFALFAQDNWLTPTFTFNYGLRCNLQSDPAGRQQRDPEPANGVTFPIGKGTSTRRKF